MCVYSRLREKRDDDISGEIIFSKYLFDILSNLFSLPLSVALRDSPLPRVVAGRRTVLRCRRRQAVWPVYSSVAKASPPLRLCLSLSFSHPPRRHRLFLSPSSIRLVLLSPPALAFVLRSSPLRRISSRYLRDTRSSRLFIPPSSLFSPLLPFKTGTPPVEKSLSLSRTRPSPVLSFPRLFLVPARNISNQTCLSSPLLSGNFSSRGGKSEKVKGNGIQKERNSTDSSELVNRRSGVGSCQRRVINERSCNDSKGFTLSRSSIDIWVKVCYD